MYMPYTTPSDLGEMLQGWVTLLFLGGGLAVGVIYLPLSNPLLIAAFVSWGLAAVLVHQMENEGEIQSRRMTLLSVLASPMMLLLLNGQLDTHRPVQVDAIVSKVRPVYSRKGRVYADIRPQHPVAGLDILHLRAGWSDSLQPGMHVRVCYQPGALGLPWGLKVDLHPLTPSGSEGP